MAIRPLPGELLEHLPRGIDQSQITHHVPLRGGPDGLLGETHLLLYRGNLEVLTRGSAKGAFRRLDLDPNERAMLLAEGWSVQLSLPTRGEPTRFDVSSKDVGTVLALISAVKPGERDDDLDVVMDVVEEAAPVAEEIVAPPAEPSPRAPVADIQAPEPRVAARAAPEPASRPSPRREPPAPEVVAAPAPVVMVDAAKETPSAAKPRTEPIAPREESWRAPRSLRDAFAENERAEKSATEETVAAERTLVGHTGHSVERSDLEALEALAETRPSEVKEPKEPSALESAASSVRDLAATFRGAAASLRSAASSLRRSRAQEPAPAPALPTDEASLAIDIDDAFDDAFDDTLAGAEAAFAAEESTAEVEAPEVSTPVVEAAPAPAKPRTKPERGGIRFNFDELPAPAPAPLRSTPVAADYDGRGALFGDADPLTEATGEGGDPNVSLAEFFDRHVPPSADDVPKRRRRMVPSATVPSPSQAPEVREVSEPAPVRSAPVAQTPVAPVRSAAITRTPVAPVRGAPVTAAPTARPLTPAAIVPAKLESSRPTPVAPPLATPVAPPPPKPAPTRVAAAEPADTAVAEDAPVSLADHPRPNRRLVPPRWTDGARRSATAAGKAAGAAATATATAASAAVGRARVAANRLLDRQRTRSGRPRLNRRRQSGRGGRPTVAIAAALMTIVALIYWALPSGDPEAVDTTAPVAEAQTDARTGMAAPIAELASEIRASQASVVPASAAHDLTPPPPGADDLIIIDDDEAAEEPAEPAADRDFYGVATLTPESPQPELIALRECRPLIARGTEVRVKVEIDEPTGTVPEVWVGDSTMDREFRQCISRQFKKATFVPKRRGKLIKQRLKLHF